MTARPEVELVGGLASEGVVRNGRVVLAHVELHQSPGSHEVVELVQEQAIVLESPKPGWSGPALADSDHVRIRPPERASVLVRSALG